MGDDGIVVLDQAFQIIFANQMDLRIPYVFAGLLTVIVVGVLMESIVFRNIETRTVIKWGMQEQ